MLDKREQFKQWRESKFAAEQPALNTALLIANYVTSIDSLEEIKENIVQKCNDFDQYDARSWGVAVFAKLLFDETLAQLPETARKEKKLFHQMSEALANLYDAGANNISANINLLFELAEKIFALEHIAITDERQYKTFILSLYTIFQIIQCNLSEIENSWKLRLLVAAVFDIKPVQPKIDFYLQHLKKMDQLNRAGKLVRNPQDQPLDSLKPIKALLQKRYLTVSGVSSVFAKRKISVVSKEGSSFFPSLGLGENTRSIQKKLELLRTDIDKVSLGISSFMKQSKEKTDLEALMEELNRFLIAAENNHQPFLNFIKEQEKLYQLLLKHTEQSQQKSLFEYMEHLKQVIYPSKQAPIAAPKTKSFPKRMQEQFSSSAKLDRLCKSALMNLANTCLWGLQSKLDQLDQKIIEGNNHLFNQDQALITWVNNESPEQLATMLKANNRISEAVHYSSKLLMMVKKNSIVLNNLQEKNIVLDEFISLHNSFKIKICSFLAQYFSFFKTEETQMFNKAVDLKIKLEILSNEYKNAIDQGLEQIERIPELDLPLKVHIKNQFKSEEQHKRQEKQNNINCNNRAVRLLMNNLSDLFITNPQPLKPVLAEEPKPGSF